MGDPLKMDGLFHGKSQSKIDDDWGYPHFRKHSYIYIYIYIHTTQLHTQLGEDFFAKPRFRAVVMSMDSFEKNHQIHRDFDKSYL